MNVDHNARMALNHYEVHRHCYFGGELPISGWLIISSGCVVFLIKLGSDVIKVPLSIRTHMMSKPVVIVANTSFFIMSNVDYFNVVSKESSSFFGGLVWMSILV